MLRAYCGWVVAGRVSGRLVNDDTIHFSVLERTACYGGSEMPYVLTTRHLLGLPPRGARSACLRHSFYGPRKATS